MHEPQSTTNKYAELKSKLFFVAKLLSFTKEINKLHTSSQVNVAWEKEIDIYFLLCMASPPRNFIVIDFCLKTMLTFTAVEQHFDLFPIWKQMEMDAFPHFIYIKSDFPVALVQFSAFNVSSLSYT